MTHKKRIEQFQIVIPGRTATIARLLPYEVPAVRTCVDCGARDDENTMIEEPDGYKCKECESAPCETEPDPMSIAHDWRENYGQ